jgi:hypothetical protein
MDKKNKILFNPKKTNTTIFIGLYLIFMIGIVSFILCLLSTLCKLFKGIKNTNKLSIDKQFRKYVIHKHKMLFLLFVCSGGIWNKSGLYYHRSENGI